MRALKIALHPDRSQDSTDTLRRWTERKRELLLEDRLERVVTVLERLVSALERRHPARRGRA